MPVNFFIKNSEKSLSNKHLTIVKQDTRKIILSVTKPSYL